MSTTDLAFEARERGRQYRTEAAAERARPRTARRMLAHTLRRAANRLEPGPVVISLDCSHR